MTTQHQPQTATQSSFTPTSATGTDKSKRERSNPPAFYDAPRSSDQSKTPYAPQTFDVHDSSNDSDPSGASNLSNVPGLSGAIDPVGLIAEQVGNPVQVDADIVIPVYNEHEELADSVLTLMQYLGSPRSVPASAQWQSPYPPQYSWNIVIADNASTDDTWSIAVDLARQYPQFVRAVRIPAKGRGRALKLAWGQSHAKVRAYMDVDLSTDIRLTDVLVGSILNGHAEVASGCRLLDESQVTRSPKREFISRSYNVLLRATLGVTFEDAQCGFKAISAKAADFLLPQIKDNEWFFDTELLTLAQTYGLPTYIFPVRWVEDAGTTVNIPDTVRKDLKGIRRMRHELAASAI
ncbi:glycosyltransferase [Bifidobacterium sp. ESL0745]|uniref:glycosyltransferase n=1 Tax=Bifidobacterium sp. ESL0745 TaxID=2983226 RepID=UPI0023F6189D|nr:glycosyltransferase [Bifidobacterium sp. ESL0745]MDF7665646.1 glycosyltransferase [Bifidobacterium sp. ESL0745]